MASQILQQAVEEIRHQVDDELYSADYNFNKIYSVPQNVDNSKKSLKFLFDYSL